MKILVISDVHLTEKFDEKKYNFLKKIISSVDQVILNGDFWDGHASTFNSFINSKWKRLFPLLKSKKSVYLYGNHDRKLFSDRRVNLFSSEEALQYGVISGNKRFIIEHGNRICPFWDEEHEKVPKLIEPFVLIGATIAVKTLGKYFFKIVSFPFNRKMKKTIKKTAKKNEMYIFGHTHFAEIDLKNYFANSGFIQDGFAQYILIENGKIELKEEWSA